MSDYIRVLFWALEKSWRHKAALLVSPIVFLAGMRVVTQTWAEAPAWVHPTIGASITLLSIALWGWLRRPPRVPRGSVGFLVAIHAPSEKDHQRLRQDFLRRLKSILEETKYAHPLRLLELPQYYAKRIVTPTEADPFLRRCRSHFIVFGGARVRHVAGKPSHILDLRCRVIHRKVPKEINKAFEREINEVWFPRVVFSINNDLAGFEVTSLLLGVMSKYIIGLASLISLDGLFAESLLESVMQEAKKIPSGSPQIDRLQTTLPDKLVQAYELNSSDLYRRWRGKKPADLLCGFNEYADKIISINPHNYHARLLKSIWHFLANRDTASAKRELSGPLDRVNAALYLNMAFLCGYEGDLDGAQHNYTLASRASPDAVAMLDAEQFITWILEEEPEKVELRFCLGLLNAHIKGDYQQAISDLEAFLQTGDSAISYRHVAIAKSRIKWCREREARGN